MMIRALSLSAALLGASTVSAVADKLSLDTISAYLNTLETAKAEFTQINDDGSISTGEVFIKRPGSIRFEYNPPDKSLVMAGRGQVAVFDPKSNQPPEIFPLVRTPLNLILAKDVNLRRQRMVVGHTVDGPATTVAAQDPDHPEYGQIQMVFTDDPVELRQWVVIDGSGGKTTVILGEMTKGMSLGLHMFNIDDEVERRGL